MVRTPPQVAFDILTEPRSRPGMRERLCFGNRKYVTDEFWLSYHQNCWFRWPHSSSEAYETKSGTGLQSLRQSFLDSILDLRFWTMDSAFLDQHPEFRADVDTASSITASSKDIQSGGLDNTRARSSRCKTRPKPLRNMSRKKGLRQHQWNSYLGSLAKMQDLIRAGGEDGELHSVVIVGDSNEG